MGKYMTRKFKHSWVGLALVATAVAAPATVNNAGAQATTWSGFSASTVETEVNLPEPGQSPAFGAATTEDLGGPGVDIWANNHALRSEGLTDWVSGGDFATIFQAGGPIDSHSSVFTDLDGDGDDDLIESAGRDSINRVFINENGTLVEATDTGLEAAGARGRGVTMVDFDNDGDMDALIANLDLAVIDIDGDGTPDGATAPSELYLNDGTGLNWTPVPDLPGAQAALFEENVRLTSLTSTGPGTEQVLITSNSFAFGINTIEIGSTELIEEFPGVRQSIGIDDNHTNVRDVALGDLDGDLDIEFVVARQQDRLGRDALGNQVDPSLAGSLPIGVGQVGIGGSSSLEIVQDVSSDALVDNCRTVALADYDNDADLDIFGGCTFEESGQNTNVVLLNDGNGNFTVDSTLVPSTGTGTAAVAVTVDLNDDGFIDTYVASGFDTDVAPDHIFLNNADSGNHWLKIDLEGSNPDAAGAQVFVGTDIWQVRETGHRNHTGQDMSTLHFGLGQQDEIAPVEIQWPDGTFETCTITGVDQRVTISQGGTNCVAQSQSGLVAAVNAEPQLPVPPVVPTCNGEVVTVDIAAGQVPTTGPDVILGTTGDDIINGLAGNDIICGLTGDDVLNGGSGSDQILAGGGNDVVNGGRGADLIFGGNGVDLLSGNNGADEIFGGVGRDRLVGGNGADTMHGGFGADVLIGGAKNDTLFGNNGNDTLQGNRGIADQLHGDDGVDTFDGGPGINDGCTAADPSGVAETQANCEIGL